MQRVLESIYIRFILDKVFAENIIKDANYALSVGLNPLEYNEFLKLPKEAVEVERRSRIAQLWDRLVHQMPWTIAIVEAQATAKEIAQVKAEFFASEFWDRQNTIPIFPYDKGFELASPLRAELIRWAKERKGIKKRLWADLAELEWNRFKNLARWQNGDTPSKEKIEVIGQSVFDLFRAIRNPKTAVERLKLKKPITWAVLASGAVCRIIKTPKNGLS